MTARMLSCLYVNLFVWLLILTGCNVRQAHDKKYYVLSAVRQAESTGAETGSILDVRRLTIDSAFGGKRLVYRIGDFEYESDFYNEFLVSPSAMITEKMRNWLSASGLFERVLDMGSVIDPTHIIEGNITALYGDFRNKSAPAATMEIRVFLLKAQPSGESVPVFGKTYESTLAVESAGPEGLIKALDRCLEEILSILEKDLRQKPLL